MAVSIPYILCSNFLIVSAAIGSVLISHSAYATYCQVYPSEYAYQEGSVRTSENVSANCRNYPPDNLQLGDHQEYYIHCNGTQFQLADSNLGQQQYQTKDYYIWNTDRDAKLLFIFPTRVSLTTITLHYHSDNHRGLPRLRFYAIPDNFNIWNATTTDTPYVDVTAVSPDGGPAGRKNVSINVTFETKKVLMYKYNSSFRLEVSEVQFFNYSSAQTTSVLTNSCSTSPNPDTESVQTTNPLPASNLATITAFTDGTNSGEFQSDSSITTTYDSVTQNRAANRVSAVLPILIGIILIALTAVVVITLVLLYLRKFTKSKAKSDYDDSYSTLCRKNTQQLQPCSQQVSTDHYDRIQLSPSTGQAEVISSAEIENINCLPSHQTDNPPNLDKEQSKQSNASISEQPTYAAVKKKQEKNKLIKGKKPGKHQNSAAEEIECRVTATDKIDIKYEQKNINQIKQKEPTPTPMHTTESPEALYAAVKKKPNAQNADNEDKLSSSPPHSVEDLYTAIKKNVKGGTTEEGAPQVPPHTVEELYTAVKKKPKNDPTIDSDTEAAPPIPPHTVEELYTAVQKGNTVTDEDEAPPIPPHTVEELYAAVMKKLKGSTEDEGQAPPYTVDAAVKRNLKDKAENEEVAPPIPPVQKGNMVTDEEEAPPIPPYTVEELYTAVQTGNMVKDEEEAPPIPPHTVEDCC